MSTPLLWLYALGSAVVLAALFELFTCILRFVFGRRGVADTMWLARYTFGVRIHHCYVGAALLPGAFLPAEALWRAAVVAVALGLILSDLFHHFVVLRHVVGSPQFDLTYPESVD